MCSYVEQYQKTTQKHLQCIDFKAIAYHLKKEPKRRHEHDYVEYHTNHPREKQLPEYIIMPAIISRPSHIANASSWCIFRHMSIQADWNRPVFAQVFGSVVLCLILMAIAHHYLIY